VAERLQRAQWATLLMDLLTEEEDQVRASRFDIDLLTGRLPAAAGGICFCLRVARQEMN